MDKVDRRTQRTKSQLQQAILELLSEKAYNAITVQDITERANVGRTTFYSHYGSKAELYMAAHFEEVAQLGQASLTIDDLLAPNPPEYFVKMLEGLTLSSRAIQLDLMRSGDWPIMARQLHQHAATIIERCLRERFQEQSSQMPFTILANYLAGAQFSLVLWWVENRISFSAQEIAAFYQQLQRTTLQNALNLVP